MRNQAIFLIMFCSALTALVQTCLKKHDWPMFDCASSTLPRHQTQFGRDTVTFNYDHVDSPWHVAFTPGLTVTDVEIGGEKVLTTGLPTRVDINEVRAKAAEQAVRLHERLAS
ncbi:MAG: hypothetical protein RLZZ534_232 [Actinomycetota bacterium]